jgi:ribosomal protein L11 methyltransferase
MNDSWPYLRVTCDPAMEEPVTAVLFDCGCSGTATDTVGDKPDPSAPLVLTAWFSDDVSRDEASRRLAVMGQGLEPASRPLVEAGLQEREDWLARWREGQQPFAVGRRLLVVPGEGDPNHEIAGDRRILRITPGMAFGTGHHETTRFCLEQLELLAGDGVDVLDMGTGSGILAVAAALLGGRRVVGVDNDPEALRVAAENLALHDLTGRVDLLLGESPVAAVGTSAFPLILANILGSTLIGMAPALAGPVLAPGGRLLLAGILAGEEQRAVVAAYRDQGLDLLLEQVDGEWAGLVMVKPAG